MENLFKWRQYQPKIILVSVRWYLRYALSYRDIEAMMSERHLSVDHTTIYRWVQKFAPEIDKRSRPYLIKLMTLGEWMKPMSKLKVDGCIYIERLIHPVKH